MNLWYIIVDNLNWLLRIQNLEDIYLEWVRELASLPEVNWSCQELRWLTIDLRREIVVLWFGHRENGECQNCFKNLSSRLIAKKIDKFSECLKKKKGLQGEQKSRRVEIYVVACLGFNPEYEFLNLTKCNYFWYPQLCEHEVGLKVTVNKK